CALLDVRTDDDLAVLGVEQYDRRQRGKRVPFRQLRQFRVGLEFDRLLEIDGGKKLFDELIDGYHWSARPLMRKNCGKFHYRPIGSDQPLSWSVVCSMLVPQILAYSFDIVCAGRRKSDHRSPQN